MDANQASNGWKGRFALLWGGQAVSILTSSVLQMAIVWYLTEKTGSALILTASTLIGYLPHAILGTFIGVFIDRYNRKLIMILSDVVIAVAGLALAAAATIWGEIPIPLIFGVLFVRSIGSAFHSPSLDAIIPTIVPRDQLARCAGYSQGFKSISLIISPGLAAMLFSVWDLGSIILLDVAGAAVAVVIVLLARIPRPAPDPDRPALNLWRETMDGLRILRGERGLLALMAVSGLYAFIYFPIGTLYPHITMTYFGGSFRESGIVETVFSAGMLLGSLLLGLIGGRVHKTGAIAVSIGVYGLGVLFTGLLPPSGLGIFIRLSAVMGMSVPFFTGMKTAIFQLKIHGDYLGRILSLSNSVSMVAMPLGLTLGGTVAEVLGVDKCFVFCGILSILLAVCAALSPSMRNCCKE